MEEKITTANYKGSSNCLFQKTLYKGKNIRFALIASVSYLLLSHFLIGLRSDQVLLVVIFNALYFASSITRKFIVAFSIFIIYWILFDYQKFFPNYKFNSVHIESLYNLEKSLFGINWNEKFVTLNEYFLHNTNTFLDIFSGLFYLCWIPVPLGFAAYLFFKSREQYFKFSLTFIIVNIIGWLGYYFIPAAPPWYVAEYGFNFNPHTPGHTAGLVRFDNFFGVKIFQSIYEKSSNVFAAMPSLHAAYTFIVVFFSYWLRMKKWLIVSSIAVIGIWFGAVYTSHHYVLDVIAGILAAILAVFIFRYFATTATGRRIVNKLVAASS